MRIATAISRAPICPCASSRRGGASTAASPSMPNAPGIERSALGLPIMFAALFAADGSSSEVLLSIARDFSPRIEAHGGREVTVDLSGLARLFGDAKTIAQEIPRTAADRGLRVRIAIAPTRAGPRLLAHHGAGITIVDDGDEAAALDELPIELLEIF